MRCPQCDKEVNELMGTGCKYCMPAIIDKFNRMAIPTIPVVVAPVAVPEPVKAEDDGMPKSVDDLHKINNKDLVTMAKDMGLNTRCSKEELIKRIAIELGL